MILLRRDGAGLDIQRSNGVLLSITAERGFADWGARDALHTKQEAYEAACAVIRHHGRPTAGPLTDAVQLANGWLIGASRLVAEGHEIELGRWFEEEGEGG